MQKYLVEKVPFKDGFIQFQVSGSGDPLVLLHGFLEDLSIWNKMINGLVSEYKIVTIDLPGHGKSSCFDDVHSMEDMAEAVKAVLDELQLEKIIIAGHSMGGYVALAFAEIYPEFIIGLALINSTPYPDSEEKKLNRMRAVEAVEYNLKNFVSLSIPQLFAPENRTRLKDNIAALKDKAILMKQEGITAALKGMKDRPSRVQLIKNGSFPTLIVFGREDSVVDIERLKKLDSIDEVTVVELEGGHMSYLEALNDLSYYFMRFIENL
ncbi:MAG: alpha/beta hydrolase [Bacteroidia bacterium]|nr:alpha/beta hydrolase [Bacteroidia bacterium]